jgi:hypothetical protein
MEIKMDTQFHLSYLSSDVINIITYHLDGFNIIRLYMTGDKMLKRTMTQLGGVRHFRIVISSPRYLLWPSIVSNFPYLDSFELIAVDSLKLFAIKDVDVSILPKSLLSLTLHFGNGLASLFHHPSANPQDSTMHCIKFMWPNLTSLQYTSYTKRNMTKDILSLLPASLTQMTTFGCLTFDVLPYLPINLTSLKFYMPDTQDTPLEWPQSLISLHVLNVRSCLIHQHFPRSLKALTIDYSTESTWYSPDESGLAGFQWFPPSLTSFCFKNHAPFKLRSKHIQCLSRSIVDLTIEANDSTREMIISSGFMDSLPPNLTQFNVFAFINSKTSSLLDEFQDCLKNLPSTLLETNLAEFSEDYFPPKLISVSLHVRMDFRSMLKTLPMSLTYLFITEILPPLLDDNVSSSFSDQLLPTESSMDENLQNETLSEFETWNHENPPMLSNLKSLVTTINSPSTFELVISRIPHITMLHVNIGSRLLFMTQLLPPTLVALRINRGFGAQTNHYNELEVLSPLTNLPNLTVLVLIGLRVQSITEAFYQSLPTTLTSIQFSFPITDPFPGSHLNWLPEPSSLGSLTSLIMNPVKSLEDAHCMRLPQNLQFLDLSNSDPTSNPQLTHNVLNLLPPYLSSLSLPVIPADIVWKREMWERFKFLKWLDFKHNFSKHDADFMRELLEQSHDY